MNEKIIIKEQPQEVIKIHEDVRKVYPILENLTVRSRAAQQIFEHENSYGYDVITVEPIDIKLQKKEVTPSYKNQEITADNGYDGLEKVTVKAKTGYETDDADVTADDIAFGKIAYNKDGRVIGTKLSSNNALIDTVDYSQSTAGENLISYYAKSAEIDISKFKNLDYAFSVSPNLKKVKLIGADDGHVTSIAYAFKYCKSLVEVPELNTVNVTSMESTFEGCGKIKEVESLNTINAERLRKTFYGCYSLEKVCKLNCTKVVDVLSLFSADYNLTDVGGLENLGQGYNSATANYSNYTLYLSDCNKLTKQSLLNIIDGLYDLANNNKPAQSLIIGSTNLAKLAAEEIAIATNKGWNVS